MLQFFRERKTWIVWGIVIFLVGTLGSGLTFFGNLFEKTEANSASEDQVQFARIGKKMVDPQKYSETLNRALATFPREDIQKMDPELIEMIQFSALNQAVQATVLLEGAKEKKIKATGREYDQAIDQILIQYNLKDIGQLKEMLKRNKYPYGDFKTSLKNDLVSQKFATMLASNVAPITQKDIQDAYTKIRAQHILITASGGQKSKQAIEALQTISRIAQEIKQGMPFSRAAIAYSQDPSVKKNKGDLGWLRIGQTVPEFEHVLFSLQKGVVSRPIYTPFGYHLIQVLDRTCAIPATLNMDTEQKQLLKNRQSQAIQAYFQTYLRAHPLTVENLALKAYQAKISGDIMGAIGAYQGLISQNPSSPAPHYFLAKLYFMLNDTESMTKELEKAKIKGELTPSLEFPALYLFLGRVEKKIGRLDTANTYFSKAITLCNKKPILLKQLKQGFESIKESTYANQITALLPLEKEVAK